jgi:hypothetical protein
LIKQTHCPKNETDSAQEEDIHHLVCVISQNHYSLWFDIGVGLVLALALAPLLLLALSSLLFFG